MTIDLAAPEALSDFSTTPDHQAKKAGMRETLRVKDLPDLERILEHTPLSDRDFWKAAGQEFPLACGSRGVDCAGWESFALVEALARETYTKDATVAATVPLDDAWRAVKSIMARFSEERTVPFAFPLPELAAP